MTRCDTKIQPHHKGRTCRGRNHRPGHLVVDMGYCQNASGLWKYRETTRVILCGIQLEIFLRDFFFDFQDVAKVICEARDPLIPVRSLRQY